VPESTGQPSSPQPPGRLRLGQAVALGVLHGPAELLPISSSGHTTLIPWLLGWDYAELEPELRKAFEVALHAGTAAALVIGLRDEVLEVARTATPRMLASIAVAAAPGALVGLLLDGPIERRLGRPPSIAVGLAVGALAMAWADRAPQEREPETATPTDSLVIGAAQACALMPGVSRSGATLTAARRRRFTRAGASRLSWHAALPIIAGATGLKLIQLGRSGLPPGAALPFAAGAAASFASTLGSTRVIGTVDRDGSLLPFVVYRLGLAAVVGRRLARGR
jgi:undecaprenyl-diphosphatase